MSVKEVIENNLIGNVTKPEAVKLHFSAWWENISKSPAEQVFVKNSYLDISNENFNNNNAKSYYDDDEDEDDDTLSYFQRLAEE